MSVLLPALPWEEQGTGQLSLSARLGPVELTHCQEPACESVSPTWQQHNQLPPSHP